MRHSLFAVSLILSVQVHAAGWLEGVQTSSLRFRRTACPLMGDPVEPCVSAETATPANFRTCPLKVKQALHDAAPKLELPAIEGRGFRAAAGDDHGYLYVKDQVQLFSVAGEFDSAALSGFFALITTGKGQALSGTRWDFKPAEARLWKGAVLYPRWGDIVIYEPIFPKEASELSQIIHDASRPRYAKIDALGAYLPLLKDAEKATVLMDVLSDPSVNVRESVPLFSYLAALKDPRSANSLLALLKDERLYEGEQAKLIGIGAKHGLVTTEIQDFLLSSMEGKDCGQVVDAAVNVYSTEARYRNALAKVISRCGIGYDAARDAVSAAAKLKIKEAVLPVVDMLDKQVPELKKALGNVNYFNAWYIEALGSAMNYLGSMRSDRALPVLKLGVYYNNPDTRLAGPARAAVDEIETGAQLAAIRTGDQAAIKWGMDLITYHDGAAKSRQLEVLDAFEAAMKSSAAVKAQIVKFLKDEVAAGYHAHDAELTARMEALSK